MSNAEHLHTSADPESEKSARSIDEFPFCDSDPAKMASSAKPDNMILERAGDGAVVNARSISDGSDLGAFDVLMYPSHNPFSDMQDQPLEIVNKDHPGNARFLTILDLYRPQHALAQNDGEVKAICADIVNQVVGKAGPSGAFKEWVVDETYDHDGFGVSMGELGDAGTSYGEEGRWEDLGSGSAARMVVLRGLLNHPECGAATGECSLIAGNGDGSSSLYGTESVFVRRNMPVAFDREDVSVGTSVVLEREKDRKDLDRSILAGRVADAIENELDTVYTGGNNCRCHLHVNVVLASEGSSAGRIWALGRGRGRGRVKLSASYCLTLRDEGEVISSGRLGIRNSSVTRQGDKAPRFLHGNEAGRKILVNSMAPRLAHFIAQKIEVAPSA